MSGDIEEDWGDRDIAIFKDRAFHVKLTGHLNNPEDFEEYTVTVKFIPPHSPKIQDVAAYVHLHTIMQIRILFLKTLLF